ncbi:uncharacterized protein LOC106668722 [Cimex lectularius]|uniref:Uncharacterized protein n=1 Tax=Cimex lectularius TaxID=79782 RepID=A0A8I6RVN3_CIMLE|nr:uncharacterized protein LOC106668722 [Cimex lectularius]
MFRVGLVLIVALSVDCTSPIRRELWNEQIDLIISLFGTAAKEKNSNLVFLRVPNLTAANTSLSVVKLGLMWSLKRDSDVFMDILNEGEMRLSGRFTLTHFKVIVKKLKYNSYNGPANLTAAKNSMDISYKIKNAHKPRQCKTEWEVFKLNHFTGLMLLSKDMHYKSVDITEEVNAKFIPEINAFFKTFSFKKYLNSYMNFCFSEFFN